MNSSGINLEDRSLQRKRQETKPLVILCPFRGPVGVILVPLIADLVEGLGATAWSPKHPRETGYPWTPDLQIICLDF